MSGFRSTVTLGLFTIMAGAMPLSAVAAGQGDPPDPQQFLESHGGKVTADEARQLLQTRFEAIDGNHDGVVSEAEFEQYFMAKFQDADTDHDGRLTRAEIRAQLIRHLQARQSAQQP